MIKRIYGFKNVKSGNFGDPRFELIPKEEAAEYYAVAIKEAPAKDQEFMKEIDVYYLGTLDTKTGEIKADCDFVVSLGSVLDGGTKEAE